MCPWSNRVVGAALTTIALLLPAETTSAEHPYGFLKDGFTDARGAALGEATVTLDPGPVTALTNPAALARTQRTAFSLVRASIFETVFDDVELSRWGLVSGWGPVGLGLLYSKLEWGEFVPPESIILFDPLPAFDVYEEEIRAGMGLSLARAFGSDGPLDLELGAAASHFRVQVPSSGAPESAVGEKASLNSFDVGAVLTYEWRAAGSGNGPLRRVAMRAGMLARDLASPRQAVNAELELFFDRVTRYGITSELGFGETVRFGSVIQLQAGFQRGSSRHAVPGTWETGWFGEVELLGILAARYGRFEDPAFGVEATTRGFGIALDWEGLPVGMRFDWAERPLARVVTGVVIDRFGIIRSYAEPLERVYTASLTSTFP